MRHAGTNGNERRAGRLAVWALSMVLLAILGSRRATHAAEMVEAGPTGELTVAMKEIPAWEVSGEWARSLFLFGNPANVQEQRQGGCTYPDFQSAAPLYGQVQLENAAGNAGFVALDHSEGKEDTYDLLYWDENADGDLTNDPPRRARKDLPAVLAEKPAHIREQIWFEPVRLPFDFGPAGRRLVEAMPRLQISEGGPKRLSFVPAAVRSGIFRISGQTYRAFLGYQGLITGRLDRPTTTLILVPEGGAPASWVGAGELKAIHLLGGRYYRFSCTPTGDRLYIRSYDGKFGVFEVVAGGRDVEKLEMGGSLYSREAAVAVANGAKTERPAPTWRCETPVGDYIPGMLEVGFDNLRVTVSNYVAAPGQPPDGHGTAAWIAIREDKPCVLDFPREPAVVFTWPRDWQVRVGEQVWIRAMLVDPVLGVMIRGLTDTASSPPGSLAPRIFIKRADGRVVAEGVMPFG